MNAKPISFRIAALCLSILLGGSYMAYRTYGARGSRSASPAELFPGSKSAPVLLPGSKSDVSMPADQTLLPGSKSLIIPAAPQQAAQPSQK